MRVVTPPPPRLATAAGAACTRARACAPRSVSVQPAQLLHQLRDRLHAGAAGALHGRHNRLGAVRPAYEWREGAQGHGWRPGGGEAAAASSQLQRAPRWAGCSRPRHASCLSTQGPSSLEVQELLNQVAVHKLPRRRRGHVLVGEGAPLRGGCGAARGADDGTCVGCTRVSSCCHPATEPAPTRGKRPVADATSALPQQAATSMPGPRGAPPARGQSRPLPSPPCASPPAEPGMRGQAAHDQCALPGGPGRRRRQKRRPTSGRRDAGARVGHLLQHLTGTAPSAQQRTVGCGSPSLPSFPRSLTEPQAPPSLRASAPAPAGSPAARTWAGAGRPPGPARR